MGIVTERRIKERRRRIRRRLLVAAMALALGAAAASHDLRDVVMAAADKVRAAAVFADIARSAQAQLTLPEMDVYALQLGVFDSGERAMAQLQLLEQEGIRCMIWQREKMRLIVSASASREGLNAAAAKGHDAYVYQEKLPKVTMRLTAGEKQLEAVQNLMMLPDSVFAALDSSQEPLEAIILQTREAAEQALSAHPENVLYTQLAQSLTGWCDLMDSAAAQENSEQLRAYASATMCALCRELREALIASDG